MALYGQGFSLRSLLEDPNLRNPPNLNKGSVDLKKGGKLGGYTPNLSSAFLGSNLWEKPSHDNNNGNDFDLEYMDLDEFLSENGIPVNPDENDESQTISLLASALARSPSRDSNPGSPGLLIDPISPGNPRPVPVGDELDKMGSFSNISSPAGQPTSPVSQMLGSPQACKVENASQSVIERYLLDDDFGIKLPSPKAEKKPEIKENNRKRKVSAMDYPVESPDMSIVSIPVYQQHSPSVRSLQSLPSPRWDPAGPEYDNEDSCSNEGELMNSLVPGQDGFDPTARKFSVEELKPQPIIKKAKKVFVDDSAKDEKYWQRRKKNNVAAKRSREARRVKENQIAMRAAFLEQECDKLRKSYEKLQRENEGLVKRLSKYEPVE